MDAQLLADKREFIVKVYRILIYSLLYSALFAFAGVRLGVSFSWWWILLELIVFVICLLVRNSLFLLYLWTSISGFTSAPILSSIIDEGQVDIIWQAILSATFLFGILTAYVHVSKRDFSYWRAILFTSLTLLILSVIPLALLPNRTAEIIWSIVGILLFSGYIVYDTSQIIHRYSRGDEVAAAFDLYLDFVNIFWDFIRIFKRTSPHPGTETTVDSPVNETDLLDTD